jgi:hypothetical protein
MKLDTDPFPINMIEFEQKKVLVRTYQAETTKGKNVAKKRRPYFLAVKPIFRIGYT